MTANTASSSVRDDPDSLPIRLLTALRRSFSLSLTAFGAGLVVFGMTIFEGVLAGMFGIWGLTALLLGGVMYTLTRYFRE